MTLPTNPIPGTRDFFPEEMSIRVQVFERLYDVVERFGYLRYDAPMLEPMELYAAKSSPEIVAQQTYHMTDRGGRELVIRPEMTPSVARMIAAKAGELTLPARWYSHPNLWRYEKKQRGRYREHWQVNVDLFGTESWEAEAEIFEILAEMMFAVGAKTEDFQLRVSDRSLLEHVLVEDAGVPKERVLEAFPILDRMGKVPIEEVEKGLVELGVASPSKVFEWLERPLADYRKKALESGPAERFRLLAVMEHGLCTSQPVQLVFEPKIFRGFLYYTSTVFEVFDTNPENPRSIAGGGRYDNLVALFGKARIPGIGFGMGDVTLIDFLHTHEIAPQPRLAADVQVLSPDADQVDRVRQIAAELRRVGLRATTPLEGRKLGKMLERAAKEGVPCAVIVGGRELSRGVVKVKDLRARAETEVPVADVAAHVKKLVQP